MESPDPYVRGRSPFTRLPSLRLGAAVGAAVLLLTSSGDGLLAGVLVGLAALDPLAGAVSVLAVLGALARFGDTSLPALAGAQAVLGPAVAVGPLVGAVGSAVAALACLLAVPRRGADVDGGPVVPVLLGLLAGLVAAGPAIAGGWADAVVRGCGAAAGVAAAWVVVPRFRLPGRRWAAAALAGLGLLLCVAAPR